jgi:uncharacterized protein with NAD-binding domain and iron-sulfur cluster
LTGGVTDFVREATIDVLEQFRSLSWRVLGPGAVVTAVRRVRLLLDLALTVIIGGLRDRVDTNPDGWFSIDDFDLNEWLTAKGGDAEMVGSVLPRSLYNLCFTPVGRGAAGTMINATWQILFHYRGGIFNKMQAGMGDTVFGPLYEVLRRRGVKFAFFHRVDELVVSGDQKSIDAVRLGVQMRPAGGATGYDPLVDVLGLPCWPSAPRYELLENGQALEASGENLESSWTAWKDVDRLVLEKGKDFDRVVLGISIGVRRRSTPGPT